LAAALPGYDLRSWTATATKLGSVSWTRGYEECLPIADRFEAPQGDPGSARSGPSSALDAQLRTTGDQVQPPSQGHFRCHD